MKPLSSKKKPNSLIKALQWFPNHFQVVKRKKDLLFTSPIWFQQQDNCSTKIWKNWKIKKNYSMMDAMIQGDSPISFNHAYFQKNKKNWIIILIIMIKKTILANQFQPSCALNPFNSQFSNKIETSTASSSFLFPLSLRWFSIFVETKTKEHNNV